MAKKSRDRKLKQAKSRQPLIMPPISSFQQQWEQATKLIMEGDLTRAEPLCAALIRQHPDGLHTLKVTGILRYYQHRYTEAISLLERAYAVNSQDIQTRRMLIASYQDGKQDEEAMSMARTLLNHPLTVEESMLAFNVFHKLCDWQTAASMLDDLISKIRTTGTRGITLGPSFLLALNGMDSVDANTMFELHHFHGSKKPSGPTLPTFTPEQLNPHERLKIAYLSPDFNVHPVAYFIYPVIASHDRQNVEVYCYAHLAKQDEITDKFREAADHFIDITAMTHAEAAQRIRADGIHVLIDLAGHTANSRLQALCWKPAPVQISWLGYPNTSCVPEVDFHITDHHAECEDGTRYMETLLYMPESFICFGMRPTCTRTEAAPMESAGFITFGSLANTGKMNPRLIGVWSRILNRVHDSRLVLKIRWRSPVTSDNILAEFSRHGINNNRILWLPHTDTYDDHVAQYNQIDIALDTFPYTGTTTTCEALFMGVPVITLVGKSHAHRVSYSILKNIGFTETITHAVDEYVDKAVTLAMNPGGLSVLRKTLSMLFEYSVVSQPRHFTPQLEALYMDACRRKGMDIS